MVNISTTQTVKPEQHSEHSARAAAISAGLAVRGVLQGFLQPQRPARATDPEADARKATSLGSGFIIDPAGYVVTNNHVIADADEITVILHDNTSLKAEVVGRDTKTDIAVLKVKTDKPLAAVELGRQRQVAGRRLGAGDRQPVRARRHASPPASSRRASATSIPAPTTISCRPTPRSTAAIRAGRCSTWTARSSASTPRSIRPRAARSASASRSRPTLAKAVVGELISEPDHIVHRGWLGVRIQAVTDEIAESLGLDKPQGALVASVTDNGPAQTGGIQPGDVILTFDGKPVTDMRHLPRLVAETPVDKIVPVTVWRKRQETDASGQGRQARRDRAGRQRKTPDKAKPTPKADAGTVTALGLTLSEHDARAEGKILARR